MIPKRKTAQRRPGQQADSFVSDELQGLQPFQEVRRRDEAPVPGVEVAVGPRGGGDPAGEQLRRDAAAHQLLPVGCQGQGSTSGWAGPEGGIPILKSRKAATPSHPPDIEPWSGNRTGPKGSATAHSLRLH